MDQASTISNYMSMRNGMRCSVPAYERIKQLYALGYSDTQISNAARGEFDDIDPNELTPSVITSIRSSNSEDFDKSRMNLGLACRDKIQEHQKFLFVASQGAELRLVKVYVHKINSALAELDELDLQELTEEGGFKNTSRFFVLLEIVTKLQTTIAKLVGTDAMRDIEIYRQKMEAKLQAEKGSGVLIPVHGKESGKTDQGVNFIE